MGVCGNTSLNGLLPSPAPLTKSAEGDERCSAARIAGVTGVAVRWAGFGGAVLIGPTVLGKCAGWEFAGGGAFRAIRAVEPGRAGLAVESARERVVTVGDGWAGATRVAESCGRALRDCADGLSRRDPGVAGTGGFISGMREVFAAGGGEFGEVASAGKLRGAGDGAATTRADSWPVGRRFPTGTRPTVVHTARLSAANKNTAAAT